MSEFIPSITLTEFKRLKAFEIKELKSVEVTSDGEHLFTAIIPHGDTHSTDFVKVNAEELGLTANLSGGKDLEEVINGLVRV
uniref:Uncharacterized protein n=1 Tax=viral metagenome TaxID=1070528 RepID=A0A6M3KTS2_9ZZZZ